MLNRTAGAPTFLPQLATDPAPQKSLRQGPMRMPAKSEFRRTRSRIFNPYNAISGSTHSRADTF